MKLACFFLILIILQALVATISLHLRIRPMIGETAKKCTYASHMSQLLVQIYKLSHTALRTKERIVKIKHDLLHIVKHVNQSKTTTKIHAKESDCSTV